MSQTSASRAPYDEPASPHDLAADCRAAGANLRMTLNPSGAAPVPIPRPVTSTSYAVPAAAARLAAGLHLHLN